LPLAGGAFAAAAFSGNSAVRIVSLATLLVVVGAAQVHDFRRGRRGETTVQAQHGSKLNITVATFVVVFARWLAFTIPARLGAHRLAHFVVKFLRA
jgi:hypothetical protein